MKNLSYILLLGVFEIQTFPKLSLPLRPSSFFASVIDHDLEIFRIFFFGFVFVTVPHSQTNTQVDLGIDWGQGHEHDKVDEYPWD